MVTLGGCIICECWIRNQKKATGPKLKRRGIKRERESVWVIADWRACGQGRGERKKQRRGKEDKNARALSEAADQMLADWLHTSWIFNVRL